jgi:hypothetical protein
VVVVVWDLPLYVLYVSLKNSEYLNRINDNIKMHVKKICRVRLHVITQCGFGGPEPSGSIYQSVSYLDR